MKQKVLLFFAILLAFQSVNAQRAGGGGSCECTSIFCTARKNCSVRGYTCTCTCAWFNCTCSKCDRSELGSVDDVVRTAENVNNGNEFITLLRSFNSLSADATATLVEQTFHALSVERDLDKYLQKGKAAEESLHTLPQPIKDDINLWIANKGGSQRL